MDRLWMSQEQDGNVHSKKTLPTVLHQHQPGLMTLRKAASMDSCCYHQILTVPSEYLSRNRDSSDQTMFFQSAAVQLAEPVSTPASDFFSWLSGVEPDVVLCCCSPSTSIFDLRCVVYSEMLFCSPQL